MEIFTRGETKEFEQLERSDVVDFTDHLEVFLKLYNEYVYTPDVEQSKALEELNQIVSILKLERYDLLLSDPSMIHDDLNVQYPMFDPRFRHMMDSREFPF